MNGKIFNLYQANKFMKHGATVVGCGVSKGAAFIQFKKDKCFFYLLDKWNKHEEI